MTYDDLKALLLTGDPLYDPKEDPHPVLQEDGLYLAGYDDDRGHKHDLLITLMGLRDLARLRVKYRDPGATDWEQTTFHDTYAEVVHWVYSL